MKLEEAVAQLDGWKEEEMFWVRRPWTATSECTVEEPGENYADPPHIKAAGLEYFLEVHTAREVLGVFGDKPPSLEEEVRLLIYYAEEDAYPDWVYER